MPDTTVRVEYIGAVQNFSEVTITGNQQVWRIGSSAFVETDRASQLVASGKFRSLANDPAMLPANQAKVTAIPSVVGIEYPAKLNGGLSIQVLPFQVGGFHFPGDTITALNNLRQFVGVNIHTGRLHCLPRLGDDGFVPVAELMTSSGEVTSIKSIALELPPSKIPRALAKLRNNEPVKVTVLGSSLLASADLTTRHIGLVMLASDTQYGYSAVSSGLSQELNTDPDFQQVGVAGWGGSPTGYTKPSSGGPNDSACIEWAGSGRLFREVGSANGQYTGVVQVIPVSGSPVVTLVIKDRSTDVVRGTSGAVAVVGLTSIQGQGTTLGTTAGVRIEISVSGGTVRMSDLSVVALAGSNVTIKNCAVGGSAAAYAFAIAAARTYKNQVTNITVDEQSVDLSHELAMAGSFQAPSGSPVSAVLDADLVIVGGLANGGTDRDLFHEPLFYALRSAGCEVLLVTDNPQSPDINTAPETWGLYPDVTALLASADAYGVAVADTSAYMTEAFLRGLPVYSDTIHQSTGVPAGASAQSVATGHECWAEALSGVLTPNLVRRGLIQGVPTFRAQQPEQPGMAKVILAPDVRTNVGTTTLSAVQSGVGGFSDYCGLFGVDAAKRLLQVPTGAKIGFGHPMMLRAHAIIQGNDFTAEVRRSNDSVLVRTINFVAGAGGARTTLIDLATSVDLGGSAGNNVGLQITVTSGTLWLMALVAHTPLYRDITDRISYRGSWAKEGAAHIEVQANVTDTVNDWMHVSDQSCRSIVVGFNDRSQGGVLTPIYDGVVQADLPVTGVSHYRYRTFRPGQLGPHQVAYRLKTAGAAPVAQNRSVSVVQAFAVLDR